MRSSLVAGTVLALMSVPAVAGPAGDIAREALYSGALADGIAKLQPLAAADDQEAWFGLGAIRLTQSFEELVQALYRHGFAVPSTASAFGPGVEIYLPSNPNPEPLDYDGVRDILAAFLNGLDEARSSFLTAAQAGDYVIEINPLLVRVDANGDGKVEEFESIVGLMAMLNATSIEELLEPPVPGAPSNFEFIGFDRADAYWLAGYTQVIGSQLDFLLAHDFSGFVNSLFHRLFPKSGFPMQDYAMGGMMMLDPETDTAIADLVAGIHTFDWPVTDAARLKGVRERLLAVLDLSHQNWAAILQETDNSHELVPSPKQTAIFPGASVDEAKVAAWLVTLDKARDVLEGRLLLPHWRFKQGFDLKAFFETATETDLVMILTGLGALPFLTDGPIATQDDFRAIEDAFGNDWLGYAFWFN
jgi:hypothetical protein